MGVKNKILIVGGGSIGKRHIANLQHMGYKNIVLLKRTMDKNLAKELAVIIVTSFEEAQKHNIAIVFVCTPTALHNKSLEFAVANDCAVFMEKPLVHNSDALLHAEALIYKLLKPFFIGFMLRFHPLVIQLKELIKANVIGNVYSARFSFGSFLPYWHPWEDYKKGYAARADLGGGVVNTISHELDLIQYLFGKPISVIGNNRNFNILGIEVEEVADAIFNYSDKVVTLHLDYLQKDYQRQIELLGEDGRIYWDWHSNEISIFEHEKIKREIKVEKDFEVNQLYIDEVAQFLKIVETNSCSHSLNGAHAITNMKLILAMHQSAYLGKRIEC